MEGQSDFHILLENDKIIILINKQIATINNKDMINYVTKSTFDLSEVVPTLIKCINMNKYVIKLIDNIDIICVLEGTLQNDTLTFSIPQLLLCDFENNNQTDIFTICEIDDDIMFKNNKKYTKYIANISTLYSYMISDIKYPIELFKKIIYTSIENETAINRTIKQTDVNYIISYLWDGLISGSFDLVIPMVNFKFDKSKIVADIEHIPQANIIINRMNAILAEYTEEKENRYLEDVNRELTRFNNCINIITQFDTIFHKLGRLYPHLSIIDCKELTKKYISQGQLTVHSGKYIEHQVNNGYRNDSPHNFNSYSYIPIKYKIWNCCPTINVMVNDVERKGKLMSLTTNSEIYYPSNIEINHQNCVRRLANIRNNIHDKSPPYIYHDQFNYNPYFVYTDVIEFIRGKKAAPYYINYTPVCRNGLEVNSGKKIINSDQLTKFIKYYGLPRPDTYCLAGESLVL